MSFPFLMDSPQPPIPHPNNSQNPQSLTTFLLMPLIQLPKQHFLYREICLLAFNDSTYLNHQSRYFSKFYSAN